jgi:hypothetical protein
MKKLAGAIVLGAIALTAATSHAAGRPDAPTTVHSSALVLHGRVRCTATVATPARVGRALQIAFRFHNLSRRTAVVDGTWLVIKASDGTTYDTRVPLENEKGPIGFGITVAPGATVKRAITNLRVRWSGPLQITPGCGTAELPALHVPVAWTAAPPSGRAAVAAVVAASGHLLDHCRPRIPGVAVDGVLRAPGNAAPPMRARCSVSLTREDGFDVAQELIVTPPGMKVRLEEPYEGLKSGRQRGNTEAVAWQFVVTRKRALSVYSAEIETMRSAKHSAQDWVWTRKGPSLGGSGICSGSGEGWGGVSGPDISWVSACR